MKGYRPQQAHTLALARRHDKAQPPIECTVWQLVKALIRNTWSPEQVVGRVEMEQGVAISHEWIYQYIYADKRSGGDLYTYLRCQKVRRKRYGAYDRRGRIPSQVSITPLQKGLPRTSTGSIPLPTTTAGNFPTTKAWPLILMPVSISRILVPPGNVA